MSTDIVQNGGTPVQEISSPQRRELVPAPDAMVDHALHTPRLLDAIAAAVAPQPLRVLPVEGGFDCEGSRDAMLVAKRILGALENASPLTPEAVAETTATIVDDVLKRDLAFRLKGLMRPIRALTFAQLDFMEDLLRRDCPLVFGIGPTGTGKTFLALAAGISLLATEEIKHLVLTRPHQMLEGEIMTAAVRAETERDEQFAVFFDILHELIGPSETQSLITHRKLEIAPLGTMRGRTFNDAFILIDEAQNMSIAKMRMAVTRAGQNARTCITGDPSQADLTNRGQQNGLAHLLSMIEEPGIGRVHHFAPRQVIRNETVARLEQLYAAEDPSFFVQLGAERQAGGRANFAA